MTDAGIVVRFWNWDRGRLFGFSRGHCGEQSWDISVCDSQDRRRLNSVLFGSLVEHGLLGSGVFGMTRRVKRSRRDWLGLAEILESVGRERGCLHFHA